MTIVIKAIILFLFLLIFFALGEALYFIVRGGDRNNSDKIVKALTWRIAISILLFLFLFFAFAMGWITPHQV